MHGRLRVLTQYPYSNSHSCHSKQSETYQSPCVTCMAFALALGYFSLSSMIGPAIVSNICPCNKALSRPSSLTYFLSFVNLESQHETEGRGGGEEERCTQDHKTLYCNVWSIE